MCCAKTTRRDFHFEIFPSNPEIRVYHVHTKREISTMYGNLRWLVFEGSVHVFGMSCSIDREIRTGATATTASSTASGVPEMDGNTHIHSQYSYTFAAEMRSAIAEHSARMKSIAR